MLKTNQKAFSLLELLIVLAIIAIIAVVGFTIFKPLERLQDSRESRRWIDVNNIMGALQMYQIDHNGMMPDGLNANWQMVGTAATGCNIECGIFNESVAYYLDNNKTLFDQGVYNLTQFDQTNSWLELTSAGQTAGSGSYDSSVKDAETEVYWNNFSWLPQRPTYKQLPNNKESETAYPSGNANMTGNTVLYHLNESSGQLADSSGSGYNATGYNAVYNASGKLLTGISFTGLGSYAAIQNMRYNVRGQVAQITVCAWLNTTSPGRNAIIDFDRLNYWSLGINTNNNQGSGMVTWNTTSEATGRNYMASTIRVDDGNWHYVCGWFDSSATNDKKIFIDGVLNRQVNGYATGVKIGTGVVRYGFLADSSRATTFNGSRYAYNFIGTLDEVSIWNRALSDTEIMDIYKRGALRLKFQVRGCDDNVCAGESFGGPGGPGTYYSEINNYTPALPTFALPEDENYRYFQYNSVFETDSASYTPELVSVKMDYNVSSTTGTTLNSSCLNLAPVLSEKLQPFPRDPKYGTDEKTYYVVKKYPTGQVEVRACQAEKNEIIRAIR